MAGFSFDSGDQDQPEETRPEGQPQEALQLVAANSLTHSSNAASNNNILASLSFLRQSTSPPRTNPSSPSSSIPAHRDSHLSPSSTAIVPSQQHQPLVTASQANNILTLSRQLQQPIQNQSSQTNEDKIAALVRKTLESMQNAILKRYPPKFFAGELNRLEKWTDDVDRLREAAVNAGGVPILLQLFRLPYGNEADVLVKVCNIITYMARNMNCLAILTRRGAIKCVLRAMKRHASHTKLQSRAANALNNLAMKDENRIQIAQEGGIQHLVQAMNEHIHYQEVQANCCNALWNLAICNENRSRICKALGVKAILQAMSRHMNDCNLFAEGCGALWNLADHPPTRTVILAEGAIPMLLAAMERHPDVVMMHRLACGAIESMLNDNDVGRVILFNHPNGVATVIAAMRKNPTDEELQSSCCGILSSLAGGDLMNLGVSSSFVATLASHGCIPLIRTALENHRSSAKVQNRGCSAISNLSYDSWVKQAMVQEHMDEVVRATLLQNAGDTVVFGTALLALSQLTDDSRLSVFQLYAQAA